MIETGDLSALPTIVAPDAQFRSPTGFKPYQSADAVVLILNTVIQVFENFEYHRQFAGANGRQVVLEFSANIGDKSLKGIDMRSEEHTSELQSLMRISYAVFCLK